MTKIRTLSLFKTVNFKNQVLNLRFDVNDILNSQTCINQIKGNILQDSPLILFRSGSYFMELLVLK